MNRCKYINTLNFTLWYTCDKQEGKIRKTHTEWRIAFCITSEMWEKWLSYWFPHCTFVVSYTVTYDNFVQPSLVKYYINNGFY